MSSNTKLIAKNPNAYHNYDIVDKIECGIVLTGTEIKSIRKGKVNLKDTYANIKNGEVKLYSMKRIFYIWNTKVRNMKLKVNHITGITVIE